MRRVLPLPLAPSIVARSPGYARSTIGAPALPRSELWNAPRYVPPRTQIVSPGRTADGCPSAVRRSQGRSRLPSPFGEPFGAT